MSKAMFRIAVVGLCVYNISATAEIIQTGPTLENQYKAVIEKANNYQDYKVIKEASLRGLWKNAFDSLVHERRNNATAKSTIAQQQQKLEELKGVLHKQEETLQQSQSKVDSISLLGIDLSKGSYNTFMWSLILGLSAVSAFCIFRVKGFKKEALYRINLFEDVTEEYKNFKTKAIEKEKRLARELQTERNKMEELQGVA
ncbi:hypothetical protein [Solitalea koreensis]|uniref:tRNA (Guanine-N1)-methyltransferase n=1 Tax=Solitalea koreensis TaxID=543615 RepID=A0A521C2U9_9SPHI|nr:hypothetical protein [Solitalea koreensis]SMO53807.1 hypothetical protein SAMN06265350_103169 [Solitalea koreensis]